MKIYKVTFNDGGWHSSLPNTMVVAESGQDAKQKALELNPQYKSGYNVWATEFKMDGYVIEVWDEVSYNRDKKIDKLI